ncbi:MAG: DNA polymerase III subunit gamma/tau [Verrucomicrobiae bacterium]|nr:DNA polymerase III subunit gamma/tau [Verrucomicrobiae bacterium]
MSYLVIARKYRPQRFADVVGQEHVTTTLINAIRSGRIAHAYLLCGPRGTGKTTLARIFAKALNATGGPKAEWDESDPRVQEIAQGRSLDVLEIDGASNNGVEAVRELRDTARFAPAASRFKIYIIDEVHMLTTGAFNALLKILEEPPAHVKFLFATTDPEKVLPTILSRCQRFDLRRIPAPLIVSHLGKIAAQEGVTIEEAALHAIARGAEGGMRDAQSTLDQLISFCGSSIVESDVLSMFGLASRGQLLALSDAMLQGEATVALRSLDELARGGKDLGRLLGDLLGHFRNLLLTLLSGADRSLVEVSDAEWDALRQQSGRADADAVGRILDVLTQAEGRLRDAPSKRIFVEVTLLKAIQARGATRLDAVLRQLRQLRDEAPAAAVTPTASPTPRVAAVSPEPPKAQAAPTPSTANIPSAPAPALPSPAVSATPAEAAAAPWTAETLWSSLHASLERSERMHWTLLSGAQVRSLERGILTVACAPDALSLLGDPKFITSLKQRARELGAGDITVNFVAGDLPAAASAALKAEPLPRPRTEPRPKESSAKSANAAKVQPVVLNKEEFLNDPAIREAMDVFRAQLLEVRAPADGAA